MATVRADVPVFQASAEGEQRWPVGSAMDFNVSGRASVRAGIEAMASLCHGIDLRAAIGAEAHVEGYAEAILPYIEAEGRAFAQAGVALTARASPDALDAAGVQLYARASAQAAVAGRIAVGLTFGDLIRLATQELPAPLGQVVAAVLEAGEAEAAVLAYAQCGASAHAHIVAQLNFGDREDKGLLIAAGMDAAVAGGAGFDFEFAVPFEDPMLVVKRVADILTEHALTELEDGDAVREAAADIIAILFPVATAVCYEIATRSSRGGVVSNADLLDAVAEAASAELQRVVCNRLGRLAVSMVATNLFPLSRGVVDAQSLHDLRRAVTVAEEAVEYGGITWDHANELVSIAIDVLDDQLENEAVRDWISVVWSMLAMASSVRDLFTTEAGASVSVLGRGESVEYRPRTVPPAPALVKAQLGTDNPTFEDLASFVAGTGEDVLVKFLPGREMRFYQRLATFCGVSPADALATGVTAALGMDITNGATFAAFKARAEEAYVRHVVTALDEWADASPEARDVIEDIYKPVMQGFLELVLDEIQGILARPDDIDFVSVQTTLEERCGALLQASFARAIAVMQRILMTATRDSIQDGSLALADAVGSDPQALAAMQNVAASSGLNVVLDSDARQQALAGLAEDFFFLAARLNGPEILTDERLLQLSDATERLLLHHKPGLGSEGTQEAWDAMLSCTSLPDLGAVGAALTTTDRILSDQAAILIDELPPIWARFILRYHEDHLNLVEDAIEQSLQAIQQAIDELSAARDALARQLQEVAAELDSLDDRIREAINELFQVSTIVRWLQDGVARIHDLAKAALEDRLEEQNAPEATRNLLRAELATLINDIESTVKSIGDLPGLEPLIKHVLCPLAEAAGAHLADLIAQMVDGLGALVGALEAVKLPSDGAVLVTAEQARNAIVQALLSDAAYAEFEDAVTTEGTLSALLAGLESDVARNRRSYRRQLDARDRARATGRAAIQILAPAGFRDGAREPRQTLFKAKIRGAHGGYADKRIQVLVNTRTWRPDWVEEDDHLVATAPIPDHFLKRGVNTIEVVVIEAGTRVEESRTFLYGGDLASQLEDLHIDVTTRINTPGDDHTEVEQEQVVLRWTGESQLDLGGWVLTDAGARHRFPLECIIRPGRRLSFVTGGDPASSTSSRVFLGEKQAVWNNDGDAAILVDPSGVRRWLREVS